MPAFTQEAKPMLRVFYSADAQGKWTEDSRMLMTYDAQGRQIAFSYSMLSDDKMMWHTLRSERYAYDGRGNQVYIETNRYEQNTGVLTERRIFEMAYNDRNQRTTMHAKVEFLLSNQSDEYESLMEYDQNACLRSEAAVNRFSSGNEFSYRIYYENDVDCNVLVRESFETIGGNERLQLRRIFTYESGLLVLEEEFTFDEEGLPIPGIRKSYSYNAAGLLTEQLEEYLFSDVYADIRLRFYYDEQQRQIRTTNELLWPGSTDWVLNGEHHYGYNDRGLMISEHLVSYSENSIDGYLNESTFDDSDKLIEEQKKTYRTDATGTRIMFNQHTNYLYDCSGRLHESIITDLLASTSELNRKIVEIYPNRPACDPLPPIEVSVFPNPTKNKVQVVWNEMQTENNEITLLNAKGELMQRYAAAQWQRPFEIDLSGLAEGMYFVRVKGTAGEVVRRVYLSK
ncbi:MAG TPA: T9SS type A sorting domain-containing protein [Cyclobacteriaceae bacterium]|nr:T9SS type A sorting domain-containing protein [Cyclobacteriaceae bacterium]